MRSTIEATLILTLSVVLTLLIMAVIFPRHALGGGASDHQKSSIEPAIFVYGTHAVPGTNQSPTAPGAADRTSENECPFLADRAKTQKCPVNPKPGAATACPFLLEKGQKKLEAETPPVQNLGQHT